MQFPVVATASALFHAVPLMAAAAARRPPRGAMAWIVTWCALKLLETAAMSALALRRNMPFSLSAYVFAATEAVPIAWGVWCRKAS